MSIIVKPQNLVPTKLNDFTELYKHRTVNKKKGQNLTDDGRRLLLPQQVGVESETLGGNRVSGKLEVRQHWSDHLVVATDDAHFRHVVSRLLHRKITGINNKLLLIIMMIIYVNSYYTIHYHPFKMLVLMLCVGGLDPNFTYESWLEYSDVKLTIFKVKLMVKLVKKGFFL